MHLSRAYGSLALGAAALISIVAACGDGGGSDASDGDAGTPLDEAGADALAHDAAFGDAASLDASSATDASFALDAGDASTGADAASDSTASDASANDAAVEASADASVDASSIDASIDGGADGSLDASGSGDASSSGDASGGVITGGPCVSGATGATAFRARWTNANGQAYVSYEAFGLPDHSRDKLGAYGYQIGFTPSYVDPFLGPGGLELDDSDFMDIELSTVGLSSISGATLAIYGRSYSVDTNGSFNWQTFDGTGSAATDFVSNVAPYQWYLADFTTEIHAGDGMVLIRVKSGPSSDALVVNRVEICLRAQ